jgi:hypothetical protein
MAEKKKAGSKKMEAKKEAPVKQEVRKNSHVLVYSSVTAVPTSRGPLTSKRWRPMQGLSPM